MLRLFPTILSEIFLQFLLYLSDSLWSIVVKINRFTQTSLKSNPFPSSCDVPPGEGKFCTFSVGHLCAHTFGCFLLASFSICHLSPPADIFSKVFMPCFLWDRHSSLGFSTMGPSTCTHLHLSGLELGMFMGCLAPRGVQITLFDFDFGTAHRPTGPNSLFCLEFGIVQVHWLRWALLNYL